MIKLQDNANSKIKGLIYEKSVISYYYSTCECYTKGYVNKFITDMQILITKLGIIISRVSINGPKISYCVSSIKYLCEKVLDSPNLVNTFIELGLNDKGNEGKHTIGKDVNIDMNRCVNAYNNLVNRIADVYGLRNLERLIVRKSTSTETTKKPTSSSSSSSKPVSSDASKRSTLNSENTTYDENIILRAALQRGDGHYTRRILFDKKSMINFRLIVEIDNMNALKIKSIDAIIRGKGNTINKKLPIQSTSVTEFDKEAHLFGGKVEATVTVEYKIGLFDYKTISVKVYKDFSV